MELCHTAVPCYFAPATHTSGCWDTAYKSDTSWFQTFAVIWILHIFFCVFPRRQIIVGRRFGTLYQFHLQRLGVQCDTALLFGNCAVWISTVVTGLSWWLYSTVLTALLWWLHCCGDGNVVILLLCWWNCCGACTVVMTALLWWLHCCSD